MAFEYDVPEEFNSGGNWHDAPGTFHLCITKIDEGTAPWGEINGFTVHYEVMEGTDKTQIGRTGHFTLDHASTDKDGGKFRRSIQGMFFIASNLVDPSQRGQKITIELDKAVSEQIVVRFVKQKRKEKKDDDGKSYIEHDGAAIFHMDDPRVDTIPKSKEALDLIEPAKRHDKKWFEPLLEKPKSDANSNGNGGGSSSAKTADFKNL